LDLSQALAGHGTDFDVDVAAIMPR
jgi:hypothetical protein